jgi:hypothetical protein
MQDVERLSRVLPKSNALHDVLYPLATGLAQLPWEETALRTYLKPRLPQALQHIAAHMTRTLIRAFPGTAAPDARQTGGRPQPVLTSPACQSACKTDPLSASKIDPPCGVEIRA